MINETQIINAEEPCVESKQTWYQRNKERLGAKRRAYSAADKERIAAKQKAYREANKQQLAAKQTAYREDNIDHIRSYQKLYCERNKEKIAAYHKIYRQAWGKNNREKLKRRHVERYTMDPLYRAIHNLRSNSYRVFRRIGVNKPAKTEALLGCTWQEAKEHIEKLFLPGMTWANHGAWHIDHKVPIATAITLDDAIKLNHISNLQPLWAADNLSKGAQVPQC